MIDSLLFAFTLNSPTSLPSVLDQLALHRYDSVAEYHIDRVDQAATKRQHLIKPEVIPTLKYQQMEQVDYQPIFGNVDVPFHSDVFWPAPIATPIVDKENELHST